MPDTRTFFRRFADSLDRMVSSAKLKTAVSAAVVAFFAAKNVAPNVPPQDRVFLWLAAAAAGTTVISLAIHGWTMEDIAAAKPDVPAPPATQVNVGDHATGVQQPPTVARFVTQVPVSPAPTKPQTSATMKTIKIPPRALLFLLMLLPLLMLAGCQSQAEYIAFREGLAGVDYPMYDQHEKLVDDAVTAGIRTPADAAVVHAETAAARGLYDKSRKDVPTTQGSIFGQ